MPPVELPEALAQLCSITDPEHLLLLSFILMQKDIQRIEDDLLRRGIVDTTPESDTESIPPQALGKQFLSVFPWPSTNYTLKMA